MKAVFDQNYVKKLSGTYVKTGTNKMELAEQLMSDIAEVKKRTGAARAVMIWCASTETFLAKSPVHADLASFEKGLQESSPDIAPSMIYAYAALKSGVPFANGAPNLTRRCSRPHYSSPRTRACPSAARISRPVRR